ncbi:MAG: metal ABC transporter permease [Gammaproteobacteria bacterium]|nr:metal ABC transporter permease [Gammaproteobacteria bacterium]
MMDDFFSRALIAGVGIALMVGPLGCVIIWRRMAYFGDTLSHAALLGIAIALLLDINTTLAVFAVCTVVSLALIAMRNRTVISSDALLGLLAHSSLALGLVCLAYMSWVRVDLMSFLFGDILAVSKRDIAIIYLVGAGLLLVLAGIWRRLFAATVSEELAEAEGINPKRVNLVFMLLMATVIALAMKIVGVLLITALLIIPAAAARRMTIGPEAMAVVASVIGVIAVVAGLNFSLYADIPSGPAIVVVASTLFALSLTPLSSYIRKSRAS